MLRVLINGNQTVNNPEGLKTLTESWKYSEDLKIFAVEISGALDFYGQDFEFFYNISRTQACGLLPIDIQKKNGDTAAWESIYNGVIFVNDIDFKLDSRIASCEIIDNSFIARVINNAETQIFTDWVTTKNGEPITPLIFNGNVSIRDNLGNTYTNRKGTRIYDLFKYHLDWMSDNNIDFESDYLVNNTAANDAWLISGISMRNGTINLPVLSFRDLMIDVHKMFHLYGYFYNNNGRITFKVEPFDFFENQNGTIEVNNFKNFGLTGNPKAYYSKIDFGSLKNVNINTTDEGVPIDPNDDWFYSFLNEYMLGYGRRDSVALTTTCNNAESLNLKMARLIPDINSISDALLHPDNTDYDEDVFLTQDASAWRQIPNMPYDLTTLPNATPLRGLFNRNFTNGNVLSRWLSEICFVEPDYPYQCEYISKTDAPLVIVGGVMFDNVSDPCNYQHPIFLNKGSILFPLGFKGGLFNIRTKLILKNITASPVNVTLRYRCWPSQELYLDYPGYYNTLAIYSTWRDPLWAPFAVPPPVDYSSSVTRTILAGETVEYNGQWEYMPFFSEGFFDLESVNLNGLEIQAGSFTTVIPVLNEIFSASIDDNLCGRYPYEFTAEGIISTEEINAIRNSQFKKLFLPNAFKNITGKHTELERNITTGVANIKLLSKNC